MITFLGNISEGKAMHGIILQSTQNLTEGVIRFLIAAGISWFSSLIGGMKSFKEHNIPLGFFSIMLGCIGFSAFFEGMADFTLDLIFRHLSIISLVLATLFILVFSDYVAKESVNPLKFMIWGAISSLLLYIQFQPGVDTIEFVNGDWSFSREEPLKSLVSILMGYYIALYVLWGIITWHKAPQSLKHHALWLPGGIALSGIILGVIHLIIPFQGNFLPFLIALNGVFNIIILTLKPSLLYVLPFKAYRIMILEKHSGLSLYDFRWMVDNIDEDLLSGLISAIKSMGEEVIKKGGIKQIAWEKGILLFHLGEKINVALLSSRTSTFLKTNLELFAQAFEAHFAEQLKHEHKEMSGFGQTKALILQYFPHIPQDKF